MPSLNNFIRRPSVNRRFAGRGHIDMLITNVLTFIFRLFMSFNEYRHHEIPFDDDLTGNDLFHAVYQCYSPAFLTDHERMNLENGGKILLPQAALEQLIDQTGIMLFKLTNPKHDHFTHCGVLEFVPSDEPFCYLPQWMMYYLLLDEGDEIYLESIHSLPSATFVRFQPQSKDFHQITNPKAVLEKVLRNFNCLTKGDVITINYLNRNYQLSVLELKPSDVVSIIECDMEVDFAPAVDSFEPKSLPTPVHDQQVSRTSSTFTAFAGEGNRLNGKIKPDDKNEQCQIGNTQRRGIPNYDYKYGLLQFSRAPIHCLNDDINEILEKSSSKIFQRFTGEGKSLRQPRNQQSK